MLSHDTLEDVGIVLLVVAALAWGSVWWWNRQAAALSTNGKGHFRSLALAAGSISLAFALTIALGVFHVPWEIRLLLTRLAVAVAGVVLALQLWARTKKVP